MSGYLASKKAGKLPKEFVNHLRDREGYRDTVYKDSLGKLTVGTGHLLTPEELKVYKEGDRLPSNLLDQYLQEDATKAYNAAQVQAAEMGIKDPEFVNALGSVNFQMGTNWKDKFPTAYGHLVAGEYPEAAQEIAMTKKGSDVKSDWHKQTPVRVEDFLNAIGEVQAKRDLAAQGLAAKQAPVDTGYEQQLADFQKYKQLGDNRADIRGNAANSITPFGEYYEPAKVEAAINRAEGRPGTAEEAKWSQLRKAMEAEDLVKEKGLATQSVTAPEYNGPGSYANPTLFGEIIRRFKEWKD